MKAPPAQKTFGRVPTLTPGRDALPTACPACGSTWLSRADQLAGETFGALTCAMCGRTLAYLHPSARPVPARPEIVAEPVAPPPNTTSADPVSPTLPPVPHARAEQDWRRADCDERCRRVRALLIGADAVGRYHPRWIEAHDPDAHAQHHAELMAALVALCTAPIAPWDVVVGTGPLAVDLGEYRCMVDGRLVHVPPTEWALLAHFARRLGRRCTVAGATADVWQGYDDGDDRRFRVTLARLLDRLGPASRLLVSRGNFGYVLLDEPYTGPVDFPPDGHPPRDPDAPWSRNYAACVLCARTDRPYQGRGLCHRCYAASRPRTGWPDKRPKKGTAP